MSLIVHPDANCSAARNDPVSLSWPVVDEWGPWTDFNIENIDNLLGNLLDTSFEVADPPPPLESSRLLHHESQFDFVLVRQNNVIVNEALRVACRHLGLDQVEWTRGGNNSGERTFPDWSGTLVSGSEEETNLIPGDTKFTRNCLRPERIGKEDKFPDSDGLAPSSAPNSETDLARSCLQQVNSYAAACGVRYFYVITNKELFLCRRTMDSPLESSIAAQRTKRVKISGLDSTRKRPQAFPLSSPQVPLSSPQVPPSSPQAFPPSSPPAIIRRSQRLAVSLNEVAADPPSSPPNIFSDSTYLGDDAYDDTGIPDCESIPWDKKEGLTVNLGLFTIHLLALISNEIRTQYEPIHVDPEYCAKLKV